MKPLLLCFLLFLGASSLAAPYLDPQMAREVLSRDYFGHPVRWSPLALPQVVAATDASPHAQQLDALFALGLLERERVTDFIDVGNGRKRLTLSWRYHWPVGQPAGAVTGVRRLHTLLSVSSPVEKDGVWYSEVRLRWYQDDLPEWVSRPEMRAFRPLRRAAESRDKPFDAVVYLYEHLGRWRIWESD